MFVRWALCVAPEKKMSHKHSRFEKIHYFGIFGWHSIGALSFVRLHFTLETKQHRTANDAKKYNGEKKLQCSIEWNFRGNCQRSAEAHWRMRNAPNKLQFQWKTKFNEKNVHSQYSNVLCWHFSTSSCSSSTTPSSVSALLVSRQRYGISIFSQQQKKKNCTPFIQWKVESTIAKIDIIQNGKRKMY